MKRIDLRSDTVTKPGQAMREAMAKAEVGDDVFGDDPTVNSLQEKAAFLAGMEAALFVPSGTQSNLCALLSHCARGDEYIVGMTAHTYKYEGGGAAVFGGIVPQPLDNEPDGTLALDKVARLIKPDDHHFAQTRLLCLEDTFHGRVLPLEYLKEAAEFTQARGLKLHLDGARAWNAAVKQGVPLREITRFFDSVSLCLSKGLGAPAGSVLCGSRELIDRAHRWRKVAGGGMRQAGILAAAGLYALEHHVARLKDDHANAGALAVGLAKLAAVKVEPPQTNMVFVHVGKAHAHELPRFLAARGIVVLPGETLRLVTHLDVDRADVPFVIGAFEDYFRSLERKA
jgi:threonine aldolase